MPWNSLTSTTAIAVIQDLLIEQLGIVGGVEEEEEEQEEGQCLAGAEGRQEQEEEKGEEEVAHESAKGNDDKEEPQMDPQHLEAVWEGVRYVRMHQLHTGWNILG
jgi:hypothetical protein